MPRLRTVPGSSQGSRRTPQRSSAERPLRRARGPVAASVAAALAGLMITAQPARTAAQTATPLDRFEPAPAADALLVTSDASVRGHLRPGAGIAVTYAHAPLVLATESSRGDPFREVVDHQVVLHVQLSLELWRRLKIEADLPSTLSQGGESATPNDARFAVPEARSLNDLRAGLRVMLRAQDGLVPAAALGLSMWLPTGDEATYTGAGSVRYAPSIIVGAAYPGFVWSAAVGRRWQGEGDGLLGSDINAALGAALRFGPLQVGPEVLGSTVADGAVPAFSRTTTNIEVLLGARYRVGPIVFSASAGPGLTTGAGTPAFRLTAGVSFAPEVTAEPPRSPDKAAAKPPESAASAHSGREVKEPGRGGKPTGLASKSPERLPDGDGDSVPDTLDACPDRPGDAKPGAARPGCPPDKDGDGIDDEADRCPAEAGVDSADPARYGCPADTDGDGIIDAADACPREKGEASEDAKASGCPTAVRVEGTQIVILQQVNFRTGSDEIDAGSFGLLKEVAGVLAEHPEIARVAVDGHTDNVGPEKKNLALSQRRALAVVRWLTANGVDARRLEARGFGPRRPIAENKKPEGRARNRRVEFQIRKRTTEGAAGWKDGPLE